MAMKIICDKCGHSEDLVKHYGWNAPIDDMYSRNPKQRWFTQKDIGHLCKECNKKYEKLIAEFR